MVKYLLLSLVLTITACTTTKTEVVPVVSAINPADFLVKPPAEAMISPVEPSPLPKGRSNGEYIVIMKNNNLNAAKDRQKLETLQEYVKGIFDKK